MSRELGVYMWTAETHFKNGWIDSQGSQLWQPCVLSCALSCTASGCCSSGWNISSPDKDQHCPVPEPQRLNFGVSVSQTAGFWQFRQVSLHWSKLLLPAWLPAPSRDFPVQGTAALATNWCHKFSVHGPWCSSKTCKSNFLLQPVNSSPETQAHATDSSKAVISQQARQTSGTATF